MLEATREMYKRSREGLRLAELDYERGVDGCHSVTE